MIDKDDLKKLAVMLQTGQKRTQKFNELDYRVFKWWINKLKVVSIQTVNKQMELLFRVKSEMANAISFKEGNKYYLIKHGNVKKITKEQHIKITHRITDFLNKKGLKI